MGGYRLKEIVAHGGSTVFTSISLSSRGVYELFNATSWLISSTGKALHEYHRNHGLKSRSNPIIFKAFFSELRT